MNKFDDFDTQVQSDEVYLKMKAGEYYESELEGKDFWEKYEIDCDDGTHGEAVYLPRQKMRPSSSGQG